MAKYRINSRGASHTRKENGDWRRYGKGDVIELSKESVDAGLYDHLRLSPVSGDTSVTSAPASQEPVKEQKTAEQLAAEQAAETDRAAAVNALIARAEEATTAKDIAAVGAEAKTVGLLENPPAKKSELIEALNELIQA